MEVIVKLPIVVRCDNIGAIFISETLISGAITHHINAKYHFVCEHVENGLIKIVFVESSINDADFNKKCGKRRI
jgi:hypothetical protein